MVFIFVFYLTFLRSFQCSGEKNVRRLATDDSADYSGFFQSTDLPFPRSDMTASKITANFDDGYNERIYLIGGCVQDQQCYHYNSSDTSGGIACSCPTISNACNYFIPAIEQWFECSPGPRKRYRHVAAVINNKIFVAGGRELAVDAFTLDSNITREIDVYDPLSDTWETPFTWETPYSDGSAFASGSNLYLVGGYNADYSLSDGWLVSLDTTTGTWNLNLPRMNIGRGDVSLVSFNSDKFYVLGGFASPNFCSASAVMESYSISSNSWTTEEPMIYPRGDVAAGTLGSNIFSIAGETKLASDVTCTRSVPVPYVSRYNLISKTWNVEASIPENIFRFKYGSYYNSSSGAFSRTIFLFGGQGTYEEDTMTYPVRNTTLKYVPISSDFSDDESEPVLSPGGISGVVIGGFVFLLFVFFAGLWYFRFRMQKYYTKADIELSAQGEKPIVFEDDA